MGSGIFNYQLDVSCRLFPLRIQVLSATLKVVDRQGGSCSSTQNDCESSPFVYAVFVGTICEEVSHSVDTHSIARALFPCHQTDSRLVGKFVPVEAGTCPTCVFLKYKSGVEAVRLHFIVRQMCLAIGTHRQIQLTIPARIKV